MIIIEANNIIVKRSAIGDYRAFLNSVPNQTHASDGELERIGFMVIEDVFAFADFLQREGYKAGDDFAVVIANQGVLTNSKWLKLIYGKLFPPSEEVFCAAFMTIATHKGWTPENAIKLTDELSANSTLVEKKGHIEKYWDKKKKQMFFIGRTNLVKSI